MMFMDVSSKVIRSIDVHRLSIESWLDIECTEGYQEHLSELDATGKRSETHQTHSAAHQTRSGNIACTEGCLEHLSEANASETG